MKTFIATLCALVAAYFIIGYVEFACDYWCTWQDHKDDCWHDLQNAIDNTDAMVVYDNPIRVDSEPYWRAIVEEADLFNKLMKRKPFWIPLNQDEREKNEYALEQVSEHFKRAYPNSTKNGF